VILPVRASRWPRPAFRRVLANVAGGCDIQGMASVKSGCTALACCVVLVTALSTAGCATPSTCAGQCRAPFELQVDFKIGTSAATARAVVAKCAQLPDVVRAGRLRRQAGSLTAVIYTRYFGKSSHTSRLFACLHSSAGVGTAGFPD
jgi:hypothetical protein